MAWIGLLMALCSCSSSDSAIDDEEWGANAVAYFDALAVAYTSNDLYGVLDFYTPNAFVAKWRGDLRGGATVRDLMLWNAGDLEQQLHSLHLGGDGALSLIRWLETDEMSAVVSRVDGAWISGETVFDLSSSLGRSLRASPNELEQYQDLYERYAETWTDGDFTDFAGLYASDASVRDPLRSLEAAGTGSIFELRAQSDEQVATTQMSRIGGAPSDDSAAIYLGPAEYGVDPGQAVGVFLEERADGCQHQVAVLWRVEDGRIKDETRLHEVSSFAKCFRDDLPRGWWTGLALPTPRDEIVTNVLRTPLGNEIDVHNGTPPLEELVHAGLTRFALAGIGEPKFRTLTFEPSRKCTERSGRLIQRDGVRQLFLCFYESDLCPGSEPCVSPALSVRVSVMHELAHAWMLDHITPDIRSDLLRFKGLETWDSEAVEWSDRGVEYSAEVIAWGLLDAPAPMARIGRPTCQELAAAFVLLTQVEPLRPAADCRTG